MENRDAIFHADPTSKRFSTSLREAAGPLWVAQLEHPFVRGIAAGALPPGRFERFVRQDYLFLVEYARVLALACARAPDLALMGRFAGLTQVVLGTEMDLHRTLASDWGIAEAELEAERAEPETRGYTDFLLRTAALDEFPVVAAALLPCMWGYSELGIALAAGPRPAEARLARWIDSYASDEFAELATWCREVVDEQAAGAGEAVRARMEDAFVACSRYELAFWEMAWRGEP